MGGDNSLGGLGSFVAGDEIKIGTGLDCYIVQGGIGAEQAVKAGGFIQPEAESDIALGVGIDYKNA